MRMALHLSSSQKDQTKSLIRQRSSVKVLKVDQWVGCHGICYEIRALLKLSTSSSTFSRNALELIGPPIFVKGFKV